MARSRRYNRKTNVPQTPPTLKELEDHCASIEARLEMVDNVSDSDKLTHSLEKCKRHIQRFNIAEKPKQEKEQPKKLTQEEKAEKRREYEKKRKEVIRS